MLRLAMEQAGITIVDCYSETRGLRFFIELFKKHRALRGTYDILFIGNSGPSNFLPLFAKLITRKPVVWEPLFSIYDNYVFDRKFAPRYSLKALYFFMMDWIGGRAADIVILDTHANCEYFSRTFHVRRDKCVRVLVGASTDVLHPISVEKKEDIFEVEYHGKYIPVQGTDVIVRAAKLLEDDPQIHFTMIGGGQVYGETVALAESLGAKNITFLPFLPMEEVKQYIAHADACFGLIGDVPRIVRAIPNKLYEAAAMGKVSINADTVGLREVFTPGVDVVGVPQGDHVAVAEAIRALKNDRSAKRLGEAAYQTLTTKVSFADIGKEVQEAFAKV